MGPESRAEGTAWAGAQGAAWGTLFLTHVGLEEMCGSWEAGGRHSPRCSQALWYYPVSHPNDPGPAPGPSSCVSRLWVDRTLCCCHTAWS